MRVRVRVLTGQQIEGYKVGDGVGHLEQDKARHEGLDLVRVKVRVR